MWLGLDFSTSDMLHYWDKASTNEVRESYTQARNKTYTRYVLVVRKP